MLGGQQVKTAPFPTRVLTRYCAPAGVLIIRNAIRVATHCGCPKADNRRSYGLPSEFALLTPDICPIIVRLSDGIAGFRSVDNAWRGWQGGHPQGRESD